jgi:hypothetical protein
MMEPIESAVTFPPGEGRERAGGARPMPNEGGVIALVEIRADPNYRVPCVAYSVGLADELGQQNTAGERACGLPIIREFRRS